MTNSITWVGIDFGTSHTRAAFHNGKTVELLSFGPNQTLIPSSVYLDEDGTMLVGDVAQRRAQLDPSRFKTEFKRDLGTEFPYLLGEHKLMPEDLVTYLLRRVHADLSTVLSAV